jgi:hypothetical protein
MGRVRDRETEGGMERGRMGEPEFNFEIFTITCRIFVMIDKSINPNIFVNYD